MNVTRQHTAQSSRPSKDAGVAEWLDALAAGSCTQEEFLRVVEDRESDDSEVPWEVLALLDQYLRREKISQDVYASLKARLQRTYMGFGSGNATPPLTRTVCCSGSCRANGFIHRANTHPCHQ